MYGTGKDTPNIRPFLSKCIYTSVRIEGFVVSDCTNWENFYKDMSKWIQNKQMSVKETVCYGFNSLPDAFIGMLKGQNVGKMVVKTEFNDNKQQINLPIVSRL